MEGYRRVDEWHLIERAIDNFDVVFLRNEDSVAQMGRGRLTREELAVLELVNGKNTVKDIIRKSRMGSFEVSKMLYRLLSIKLVRRRVRPSRCEAREHLVVDVGGRKLAVPTEHAREVAAAGWVTPVPLSHAPIAGVTQLRGQIIPVLDVVDPPRAVQPEDPLLVLELGETKAALVFARLCPPDETHADAEPLDVRALFARTLSMSEWDDDELRSLRAFFLDEADEHLEDAERAAAADCARARAKPRSSRPVAHVAHDQGLGRLRRTARSRARRARLRRSADRAALRAHHHRRGAAVAGGGARRAQRARRRRARRGAPAATAATDAHAAAADAAARDRRAVERPTPGQEQTVRVEVERIDELMDAASELVFDRTRLQRRLQDLERARA